MLIKRVIAFLLFVILVSMSLNISVFAQDSVETVISGDFNCASLMLMEANTGKVLYENNADKPLPPASVTKIMTLLLTMEAIDSGVLHLDTMLTCSANASSMGGSQIYLKEGETMTVDELVKSVVISSANDAAVVLAEAIGGSEEAFVEKMNKRAKELGMNNTNFENTNGLDDTAVNHVTSARDIALMSRELMKHKKIFDYSTVWMDTVRNGTFGLTNTNRLIRFYNGATGLKTGSTSKAGYCISATAERDGMHLICVVMGAETRDERNAIATKLLDSGFAGYSLYRDTHECGSAQVSGGVSDSVKLECNEFLYVVEKDKVQQVEKDVHVKERLSAPLKVGDEAGSVDYKLNGEIIGTSIIRVSENVSKISYFQILLRIISAFLL